MGYLLLKTFTHRFHKAATNSTLSSKWREIFQNSPISTFLARVQKLVQFGVAAIVHYFFNLSISSRGTFKIMKLNSRDGNFLNIISAPKIFHFFIDLIGLILSNLFKFNNSEYGPTIRPCYSCFVGYG